MCIRDRPAWISGSATRLTEEKLQSGGDPSGPRPFIMSVARYDHHPQSRRIHPLLAQYSFEPPNIADSFRILGRFRIAVGPPLFVAADAEVDAGLRRWLSLD